MADIEWSRVEGMVIAPDLDPMELATHLRDSAVVAQIEWYDATPHLVGIRVASDGEHVATLKKRGRVFHAGPTRDEFAKEIAHAFGAEVMIGEIHVDEISGDHSTLISGMESESDDLPVRIIEIGRTPSSAIPLMAAFEGVDIAEIEMPEGKRLLAAQVPPHRVGWYFGDAPLVTLTMHGDEFQAFFVREDDPESVVAYNWGMNEVTIAGAQGWDEAVSQATHALIGARPDIEAIHDAVPGIDAEAAFAASQQRGPQAVAAFVAALGLSPDITAFLTGAKMLDQIDGAVVHHARGISNAIGRSVDILLDERSDGSRFWESYTDTIVSKPWLVPAATAVEAAVGTTLLVIGRRRGGRRSLPAKVGTLFGVWMIADSVAQNLLAKYTARRAHRRDQRAHRIEISSD